jgi:class 3 adenylate cyclase
LYRLAVAQLSSSARASLPDRAFAYVDSQGRRRLPIHDASHVRNALARFGQVQFENEAARDKARTRLLQAARRFRIVPIGFIATQLEIAQRPSAVGGMLPTGFVTMLMTDIEGSTGLVEQLGGQFGSLIDAVWAAIRGAVTQAGGVEVEARADEFFAAFEAPAAAVAAAIAMQRAMADRAFLDGVAVRVRAGIHSGYPTLTAANYVGIDVNATARITSLGHGGQILVSGATKEAIRASDPGELRFIGLGSHRLRGLADEVELFQVATKGLSTRFPPLRRGGDGRTATARRRPTTAPPADPSPPVSTAPTR